MVSFYKYAALALTVTAVAAVDGVEIYHKDKLAVNACTAILKKTALFFGSKDKVGYCNTKLQQALGSMAHCLRQLPSDIGVNAFIESCEKYNLTLEDFDAAYDNATQYLVTNTSAYPGFNLTEKFYLPVKIGQKKLNGAFDSTVGRWYNYNYANYYGWVLIAYWAVLILFAGFLNMVSAMFPRYVQSLNGKVSNMIKKYVTMPALIRQKRVQHGKLFRFIEFVIPSRIESIQLFVWFILALAFNVANFHHDSPNVIWKSEAAEIGRKIADRSGVMVLYVIPQLVLFAGRNNFMQWISGWTYSRFNVIHHWMARIAFILMVVHAVGMTYNGKNIGAGKYEARNAKPYVQWGYVATICAGLMCFHAMSFIRKNNYESFVLAHNVLGAIFVAGTWIHVANDNFQQMMIATTAVWAFDKAARLARMAVFGVRTADVQLIAGETLRVKVPRPSYWKPHPTNYAFIYFFRASCFWQSHPFTIVDSAVEQNVISFYIKVKGGMSNSLYQYLAKQPDQRAQIKCSVEGPYGPRISLQHYNTVAYLSGGNGIPGMFASATHLAKKGTHQKLKLYWVIRHWKSIEWFYEELRSLQNLSVQPIIYVTQFNTPLDESFIEKFKGNNESLETTSLEKDSEKDSEHEKEVNSENAARVMSALPFIEFRAGRPDVAAIVKSEIAESAGSTAFVACGHDTFVDHSRKVVVDSLENGKRVDFFDTMETW
ncbi:hypothetical protein OXX59_008000 [Metschnikowia pulcherrima]